MLQFGEKKCRNYNRKLYLRSTWRLLMAWQKHFQCTQVSIWPGLSTAPVTVLSRRRFCSWFWCNHFLGQRIVSFCSVIRTFSVLVLFCKNIVSPLAHNIPWIVWTASCEVHFYQLPHLPKLDLILSLSYIDSHLVYDRAEWRKGSI